MKIANNKIDSYIKNIDQEKIAGALIFGPSQPVALSRFNFIAKKIVDNLQDQFLVCDLSKERLSNDKSALADEFYAISMFGGRKLIIIREPQIQALNALKDLLKDSEEVKKSDHFILILAGDLDKSSALRKLAESSENIAALACYEDSDFVVKKLIEQRLKKNPQGFEYNVIDYLFNILPNNRQIIALEIDKILTFLDEKKVTVENIENIIKDQREIAFDDFLNSFILSDKKNSTLKLDKLLESGFEPILLIRFMTNYLLKLYDAKSSVDSLEFSFDEAVRKQRLFFKAQDNFKRHLRLSSLKQIKKWLSDLQDLEVKMKSSMSKISKMTLMNYVIS